MILYLLSWIASAVIGLFSLICLAAGLFYIAEQIEEYSVIAKKVLHATFYATICLNIIVGLFTTIPLSVTATALIAHGAYYVMLQGFPYLDVDWKFGASLCLTVFHNFLTFRHFANERYPFDEITAYFTVCVWLMPFGLFVSLSVNDFVLPSISSNDHSHR
eukprot:m.154111 g.154111  ORF g.154111 m.154111 type:complete len:161 (+) comp30869_c0_seq2:298-780(+)